jgi:hypothetical protein
MKIKMTVSMAGDDFTVDAGEETERFSDAEAQRMIVAGYAVPVVETAAAVAKRDAKARAPKRETR